MGGDLSESFCGDLSESGPMNTNTNTTTNNNFDTDSHTDATNSTSSTSTISTTYTSQCKDPSYKTSVSWNVTCGIDILNAITARDAKTPWFCCFFIQGLLSVLTSDFQTPFRRKP